MNTNCALYIIKRSALCVLISLTAALSTLYAQKSAADIEVSRETIIIAPVENVSDRDDLTEDYYDNVVDAFRASKRFEVLRSNTLNFYLEKKEVDLNELKINSEKIAKACRLMKADYIVFPRISRAGVSFSTSEESEIETNSDGAYTKTYYDVETHTHYAVVGLEVYDGISGSLLFSDVEEAEYEKEKQRPVKAEKYDSNGMMIESSEMTGAAKVVTKIGGAIISAIAGEMVFAVLFDRASEDIVTGVLTTLPLRGKVFSVKKGKVFINLGRDNGLHSKVNMKLVPGDDKVSEDDYPILRISTIGNKFSIAEVVKGDIKNASDGSSVHVINPIFVPGVAVRSFIPGLGQFTTGRPKSGVLFLAADTALVGLALINANRASFSYINQRDTFDDKIWDADNKEGGSQFEKARNGHIAMTAVLSSAALGVYIANIINAGFVADKYKPYAARESLVPHMAFDAQTKSTILGFSRGF